jgi:hypothetical protein
MASILRVNTLTDASSNNSIAMSFVAGGSAKVYIDLTGTSTINLNKSLNVSGTTDNGTGDYTYTYSNNFDSVNYSVVCDVVFTSGGAQNTRITSAASGNARILTTDTGNANIADALKLYGVNHGDLA